MSSIAGRTYVANPLSFFRKKQIQITLNKYAFAPGETIKGSVGLRLKRPLQARKLTVTLRGLRIVHEGGMAVGPVRVGSQGPQTHVYTIYDFEIPLDGEAAYFNELYPFEITIPSDILQSAQQSFHSTLTGLGKTVTEIAQLMEQLRLADSRVEWSLEAKLDVPLKIDVCTSQKIVIS
jgi:hypothetical protein